jgi:AcrR family transcriptional regulator
MPAKGDRRHQQGDASRERILNATIEIAAERGYEGTSMSLIRERSGLPMSSIYWHFANKDELLAAVIRRSFDRWAEATARAWEPTPGTSRREHLSTQLREQGGSLWRNPEFLRLGLMLSLERRPDEPTARALFLDVRQHVLDQLIDAYRDMFVEEGVDSDPALSRRLARLTMAAADGLFVAHEIDGDDDDLAATLELLGSLIDHALDTALAAAR